MGVPTGAVAMIRPTVQASKVAWTGSQEWPLNLLAVCDMTTVPAINPDAASFVAALDANLADLRMTNVADTLIPWRRAENALFSQTPGAEKLYVRVKADLSGDANTEYRGYRGCSGDGAEDTGANVVGAATAQFCDLSETGASDREDLTENGLDLTPNEAMTAGAGIVGNGFSNVGVTDGRLWRLHSDLLLGGADGFTVSVWYKPSVRVTWGVIAELGYFTGNYAFWRLQWFSDTTNVQAGMRVGRSWWTSAGGTLTVDQWNHLAMVNDVDGRMQLYVNGSPVASDSAGNLFSTPTGGTGQYLGRYNAGNATYGVWDELLVSSAVWTPEQIVSHYNMIATPDEWCVCGAEESLATGRSRPFSQMRCGPRLVIGGVI